MSEQNPEKEDFNKLVAMAMEQPGLASMKPVVEKEILHYDIFQALDAAGLLKDLVFQGGTSLRLCHGSSRFSEDLDFVGGKDFNTEKMQLIKECIETRIKGHYGFKVTIKEPKPRDASRTVSVDKWEVSVETSPGSKGIPTQRIKLEIANVPAYTRQVMPLLTNYPFLQKNKLVLVPTESLVEVMADKVLAFPTSLFDNNGDPAAISSNKIRHRDIWDLTWIAQQNTALDPQMVVDKTKDYGLANYAALLDNAMARLPEIVGSKEFKDQMRRFIDADTFEQRLGKPDFLAYLVDTVNKIFVSMKSHLVPMPTAAPSQFKI